MPERKFSSLLCCESKFLYCKLPYIVLVQNALQFLFQSDTFHVKLNEQGKVGKVILTESVPEVIAPKRVNNYIEKS